MQSSTYRTNVRQREGTTRQITWTQFERLRQVLQPIAFSGNIQDRFALTALDIGNNKAARRIDRDANVVAGPKRDVLAPFVHVSIQRRKVIERDRARLDDDGQEGDLDPPFFAQVFEKMLHLHQSVHVVFVTVAEVRNGIGLGHCFDHGLLDAPYRLHFVRFQVFDRGRVLWRVSLLESGVLLFWGCRSFEK